MNVGISVPLPAYLVDVGFMARAELTRIAEAVR